MRTVSSSSSVLATAALFVTTLSSLTTLSSSHECDNHDSIPTIANLVDLFQLQRVEDGSYYTPAHRSNVQVIDDPSLVTSLDYVDSSSINLFLLTDEVNDYEWCWAFDACGQYEEDSDSEDAYEPCWEECVNTTSITYGVSYFHRLKRDETWHFYSGDTIYLYELDNNVAGDMVVTVLGADTEHGEEVLSHTVKAGTWFAAQVNPDSESDEPYALGGTSYAPAFEEGDYELADVAYQYTFLEFEFSNAFDKIRELSFHPDKNILEDDPYAKEGVNSLCHNDHDDEDEEMTLAEVIEWFGMEEGPKGGYYAESYRAAEDVLTSYGGLRSAVSSLYYAMNDTVFFHKQHSDETFHFHYGEPLILYEIDDTATPRVLKATPIGSDITIGEIPHYTVKAEHWIALEFKNTNLTYWSATNSTPYALMSLTNGPGFDVDDLEYGVPEAMIKNFPEFASTIQSLYDAVNEDDDDDDDVELDDDLIGCNMTNATDFNATDFNATDFNVTDCGDNFTFAGANSQNFAVAPEDKNGGMVTLYVLLGVACVAIIALVLKKNKHLYGDEREVVPGPPDGITVVCERGGHVQNLEAISVAGKSRGSISYIDFAGLVHKQ